MDVHKFAGQYWNRNFLLMGIPRSGTSLFVKMLNQISGVYCFNEMWYDISTIPGFFANTRIAIKNGKPVKNTFDDNGDFTTDTLTEEHKLETTVKYSENLVLGLKANETFTFLLDRLLFNTYICICLVRHPVYCIGSWNSPKAKGKLNAYDIETDERYKKFNFKGTKFERQAQLWEYQAEKFVHFRDYINLYKYEDWTLDPSMPLRDFAGEFGVVVPEVEPFECFNDDDRYKDLDEIREAVKKYCKSVKEFGYTI